MQNALLNLTMLAFLFLLFANMHRGRQSRRLRYWTFGWLLLLFNGALALAHPGDPRLATAQYILHLQFLTLAAIAFLISFLFDIPTPRQRVRLSLYLALPTSALTLLVFTVPVPAWLLTLAILAGQSIALWQTLHILGGARGLRRLSVQAVTLVACLAMLLAVRRSPHSIPDFAFTQILLAAALLLWTSPHRDGTGTSPRTPGVLAACAGLTLWASLGPTVMLFGELMPHLVVSPMFWNFPKFFAGFGMLLMLQEEAGSQAHELSEKYRLLFDHHPLPMWVFHTETLRFLMVNDAAVAAYGYTRPQFASMTIEDIRPPEDLPRLRSYLSTGPRTLSQAPGWRHLLADGTQIAVDIFSHTIRFEHHPARLVVAVDVTKRNAAEEKLRQAYKLESLGQLTGGVAHDFNNILAIILGNLELIEQKKLLDPAGEQLVHQAMASVHRGAELTRRLLAYAMQQPLEPRRVVLPRLLEQTVRFMQSSLGPMIAVQVLCDPLLWTAHIDPGQLENALLNLAVNARDAMGESGEIDIRCHNLQLDHPLSGLLGEIAPGHYIVLSFTDNGIGMSGEVLQRATEPFFTTKAVGKGTGLGLSMVYGFLKQSGGHMQIESQPHAGTTVRMYLPRASDTERRAVPRSRGGPMEGLPGGQEQILVVEDEHAIRTVLAYLLRSLGYAVLEAEDGPTALKHLEQSSPIDLLLTDVVLPNGISGGLLAADARALRPNLKVLFSSGYTRNALIHDRRLEEGVHLLTKPFRLAELATTVRRVLDHNEPS